MTWRAVTFVVWAVLALALVACEVAAKLAPARWPSAGSVVRRLQGRVAGRVVVLLVWMWLGFHAFAR
jgi:hypothetical protein